MRRTSTHSAHTLWRNLSTNLMADDRRTALFVSAEGEEGEVESALEACRAGVAEGFSVCLVIAIADDGRDPPGLAGVGSGRIAAVISVAGHDFQIEQGMENQPDILRLKLEGALLRDLVTHVDTDANSNVGDLRDELLAQICGRFEFSVLAGGSVLSDPYSLLFADRVGGVILVLRSGMAKLDRAARAKSLIEASGGDILGAVMTDQRAYLPEWLDRRL